MRWDEGRAGLLEFPAYHGVLAIKDVPGIAVDDTKAQKVGEWKDSTFSGTYIGSGYTHDMDTGKGKKTITFQPEIPASGRYEVWLAYSAGSTLAMSDLLWGQQTSGSAASKTARPP